MTMKVRVLHIFSPNYKHRFGGPIFEWQQVFKRWSNTDVKHLVLDHEQGLIKDANEAFDFKPSSSQFIPSKFSRAFWIKSLLNNLNRYKSDYDLIHFHVLWWAGLVAALYTKLLGVPTIYQSVLLNEDTPSGVINQPFGKLKLKLIQKFSLILALTEPLRQDYLAYGFPQERVVTLMNSVDTDLFHPVSNLEEKNELRKKFSLPENATILIFTGSLIYRKGVDILVEAFVRLAPQNPNLFLLLIGPNAIKENPSLDPKFINQLEQMIAENGLVERVKFWGLEADRSILSDLYQASDIFTFPSRNEGLGYVVLEAMASGIPVVVSNLPVLKDIVTDRTNGYVVASQDVDSLAHAISDVIEQPNNLIDVVNKAREYVLQNHVFAHWQSSMSAIYNKTLGN